MRSFWRWMVAIGCVGLLVTMLRAQETPEKTSQPGAVRPVPGPNGYPAPGLPQPNGQYGYPSRYDAATSTFQPNAGLSANYVDPHPAIQGWNQQYINGQVVYTPVPGTAAPAVNQEFQNIVAKLRSAKTDEERAEARKRLGEIIATQLDEDLAEREKRIAMIETRAKELRDQVQKRRESKAELQKMLVMLVENQQAGLGIPQSWLNPINTPYPVQITNPTPYDNSYSTPVSAPSAKLETR